LLIRGQNYSKDLKSGSIISFKAGKEDLKAKEAATGKTQSPNRLSHTPGLEDEAYVEKMIGNQCNQTSFDQGGRGSSQMDSSV